MTIKLVDDWHRGYQWFSSWAFVIVVFLATEPLPPEVMQMLPERLQKALIVITALSGLLLRFIKQSQGQR